MLTVCAEIHNSSETRENAEKYLLITATYRKVSCLRFSANPLNS
jgi:hypothetical protein